MQRKNEDTYKIFHGMKPVKRQVRRDNQSGWYYLDPRGAENFSDMKEIGVESENSPNPKIKAILADDMHKNPDDYYVWRTKKDDKVRDSHREREGKVFNWHVPPEGGHPGEDHNCRCWAEAYRPDLMAHLNITPKVDLSGLPQYAANDKTGSVSDAKYVSAENDKVEAQDKNAVAVPVSTPKPEVPAQTTAKKIVPVPARKPLTGQGLVKEMLRRYVAERSAYLQPNLAPLNSTNSYTTELGNMAIDAPIQFVENEEDKERISKKVFDEIYYSKTDKKGNLLYKGTDKHEGSFSDRKNDLGGKTNYGITQSSLDEYNLWKHPLKRGIDFPKDVKQLTPEQSKQILYEMYYMRYGINQITNIKIARNVFDEEMNQGTAAGFDLVSAINEYKNTKFPYNSIVSDSLAAFVNLLSEKETIEMNDILTQKRMDRYFYSVDKHPEKNINNLRGWYNRASTYYSNPKIFENLYKSKVDYYIQKKYPQYYDGE